MKNPPPTSYRTARMRLAEECSELIKALMKWEQYGIRPTFRGVTYNNEHDFLSEMQDVQKCINYVEQFQRIGDA